MKSTQGAGLIGDEALDFLAILSLPFIDLGPRSCTYKNSNRIFAETTVPI